MKTEITNQDTIENERAKLAKFIEVRLREREEKMKINYGIYFQQTMGYNFFSKLWDV